MRLLLILLVLGLCGCPPARPAIHERALILNEQCAAFIARDKLDDAETACDQGLRFSDHYADLWVNKGLIAKQRGLPAEAKEHLIKAIRLNQEHAPAYLNLGVLYYEAHDYSAARKQLERALDVDPDYPQALYNLFLVQYALKDRDAAKKTLRTLIQVHPQIANPYVDLGMMELEDKHPDAAVEPLNKAVELNPSESRAYMYLGVALHELGRNSDARSAFESCIDSDPPNAELCRKSLNISAPPK